jgi:predicted Zn-dependent peptidase
MVRKTRLPNGLRVVSEPLPGMPSVTVGLWVENGSRFERPQQRGISHFVEHMLFKGTARRTAKQIAEEIDALGGVLNAFTGKECTCYYARVLAEHAGIALELLADIFVNSRFDTAEIECERSVVLQEISQVEDTPDEHIHDVFSLNYWPQHPLGFPVHGSTETVGELRREDFLDFLRTRHVPEQIVVAAAGDCAHETLEEWAARDFSGLEGSAELNGNRPPREEQGVFVVEKDLEQVHVCLGLPGVSQTAPERIAAWVLNTALGGGMSSRLFQEVRERRGRAYSVYSFLSSYRDAGYLGVYVGTAAEWVEEVLQVILAELRSVVRNGLETGELTRSKNQLKGNMLLGLETSEARMSRVARNEIYFGRDIPIGEMASVIDATTNEEIVALAERLIRPESMALALLGDLKGRTFDTSVFDGF